MEWCIFAHSFHVLSSDFCRTHAAVAQGILTWWLCPCPSNQRPYPILRERPKMLIGFLSILRSSSRLQLAPWACTSCVLPQFSFYIPVVDSQCLDFSERFWTIMKFPSVLQLYLRLQQDLLICTSGGDIFSPALTWVFLKSTQERLIERNWGWVQNPLDSEASRDQLSCQPSLEL